MTFREKYEKEHTRELLELENFCPVDFGYEEERNCAKGLSCNECWDREIPEERVEKMEGKKMKTIITVREPDSCGNVVFEYDDFYDSLTIMQECAKKGKVVEVEMRECDDSTDNH